jgi:hypothetical protein
VSSKIGRNDPCQCGSGQKYKKCCMQKNLSELPVTWADEDGMHVISKGEKPTASEIEKMSKEYQNQVRSSPLWDEMVNEFGKEKAEELLKEFKAEVQ